MSRELTRRVPNQLGYALLFLLFASFQAQASAVAILPESMPSEIYLYAAQAQNWINNVRYELELYWDNLTGVARKESFSDFVFAIDALMFTASNFEEFPDESLQHARVALFLSLRANYRIFLALTEREIQEANATIWSIPQYIPKPHTAVRLFNESVTILEEWRFTEYFQAGFIDPGPERINATVQILTNAATYLYHGSSTLGIESARSLATKAREEATDYLASESAAANEQRDSQLAASRMEGGLVVLLPLFTSFVLLPGVYLAPLRFARQKLVSLRWRKLRWNGYLWGRKINGGLTVGLGLLLSSSTILTISWLWAQSSLESTYGLKQSLDYAFVAATTWVSLFTAILAIGLAVTNWGTPRWRRSTGLLCLVALIVSLALRLVTLSPIAEVIL